MRKINFFYYIFISNIILILAFINTDFFLNRLLILVIMAFLGIALKNHFYEIKDLVKKESFHKMSKRKSYTDEFKTMIAELVLSEKTPKEVASEYSISETAVLNWAKKKAPINVV